jgi:hypothetical protein
MVLQSETGDVSGTFKRGLQGLSLKSTGECRHVICGLVGFCDTSLQVILNGVLVNKYLLLIAFPVLLAGCITKGQLETSLKSLKGQPIDAAIARYGYPTSQIEIPPKTIYWWDSTAGILSPSMTNSTTTGVAGGLQFQASTTMDPESVDCTVDFVVDNGVIVSGDYNGSMRACQRFYVK